MSAGRDRDKVFNSEAERYVRTLPAEHRPGRAQRSACHVRSQVFVPSVGGRLLCSVSMISTDGLSFKDAYDVERLVTDILV